MCVGVLTRRKTCQDSESSSVGAVSTRADSAAGHTAYTPIVLCVCPNKRFLTARGRPRRVLEIYIDHSSCGVSSGISFS